MPCQSYLRFQSVMFWLDLTEKLSTFFFLLSTLHFSLHLTLCTAPRSLKCSKHWSKTPESAAPAHEHLPDFWSSELQRADSNRPLCGKLLMQCPQPCKSLQVVPAQAWQSRQWVLESPASADIPTTHSGMQRLKLYPEIWWQKASLIFSYVLSHLGTGRVSRIQHLYVKTI